MEPPAPERLMELIRALPAAPPLLEGVAGREDVYLVGGALRDLLTGGAPIDLDLVVEGDAIAAARLLGGEMTVHGRFGTCTVTLAGAVYDFASARRERYARPGALPDVAPASLSEDLRRRDFTVNALAVRLSSGELLAVAHALEDLARGRLRVLHSESFRDDPTRLFRLARYVARLGFAPETATERLAGEAIGARVLETVSGERIGRELRLLACERDPLAAFAAVRGLGLDRALRAGFGIHDAELAAAALALLPASARHDRLVLALACRELPRETVPALLGWLGLRAADRDVIAATVDGADTLASGLSRAAAPSAVAALARAAPTELVALAGALGPRQRAADWLARQREIGLEIAGEDLLAAGVPAGPAIGRGLRAALAAKLDGAAPDRSAELEVALAAARGPDPAHPSV